jgi:uncharacterized membrane protein
MDSKDYLRRFSMGEQVVRQVFVALFPSQDGAQQGLAVLETDKKAITLVNSAVIHKDAAGQVKVKENTGLSARLHGADFPDDQLEALGQSLEAGSSALVASIDIKALSQVEAKLKAAGATRVSDEMGDEIMAKVLADAINMRNSSATLDRVNTSSQAVLGASGALTLRPSQMTTLEGDHTPDVPGK